MKRSIKIGVARSVWAVIETELDIPEEVADDDGVHDSAALFELVRRHRSDWKDVKPTHESIDEDDPFEICIQ
ncbi:hypothetical protein AB0H73_18810 [Streptomyces olivoreticuli]